MSDTEAPPQEFPGGEILDCTDPANQGEALRQAAAAVAAGQLVVLPTDTVYGIGADAFNPQATASLLAAKGRGRQMPPPVLIADLNILPALAVDLTPGALALAEEFWPGPLTIICHAQPSLAWDLGDTQGTVALRIPADPLALELLKITGPMAVSSANRTGFPPALTAAAAHRQLGAKVAYYLAAAPGESATVSTIVDTTAAIPTVVRPGQLTTARLAAITEVVGPPEETD